MSIRLSPPDKDKEPLLPAKGLVLADVRCGEKVNALDSYQKMKTRYVSKGHGCPSLVP